MSAAQKREAPWMACVEAALTALGGFLRETHWHGRENELVNLYAHSFLLDPRDGPVLHPSQIGIEVAVKQLARDGAKLVVRKDLVLWEKPNQTVWADRKPANDPAVVIEFKINDDRKCRADITWLQAYTKVHPAVLGYSVCGFTGERRGISYHRIRIGAIDASGCAPSDVLPRRVSLGKFTSSPRVVEN